MKRIFLLLVLTALAVPSVLGWGGREHRLIAYIAEAHLTPQTRKALDRYLDQSIVEYSLWMDRYRDAPGYEFTTYWHMVTIDENGDAPMEPVRKSGNGDAIRQLTRALERLRNYGELSDSTVNVNLKYIIHLVGEIHCPSHIYFSDLPGGIHAKPHYDFFRLKYKGEATTYHAVWDLSLSRLHPTWDEEDFRRELDTYDEQERIAVSNGTPVDWAGECGRNCRVIYNWAKPGDNLDESFYSKYGELAEEQAIKGAYRLARVLNDLFGG